MGTLGIMKLLLGLDHLPATDEEATQCLEAIFRLGTRRATALALYSVYRTCGHSVLESVQNVLLHAVGEHDKAVPLNVPKTESLPKAES